MQQNPSPAIPQASSVPLPSPGTPVVATPVSSPQVTPQSTPHTAGSVGLPATTFDTPCMSRHMSHSRRPASPASTFDSLDTLLQNWMVPHLYIKGEGLVKHHNP